MDPKSRQESPKASKNTPMDAQEMSETPQVTPKTTPTYSRRPPKANGHPIEVRNTSSDTRDYTNVPPKAPKSVKGHPKDTQNDMKTARKTSQGHLESTQEQSREKATHHETSFSAVKKSRPNRRRGATILNENSVISQRFFQEIEAPPQRNA